MSSLYVRQQVLDFLAAEIPAEKVIDLTGAYQEIKELVAHAGLTDKDPWLGIEFIGNSEQPITVGSDNEKGKYRELGAVYFHIVGIAKLGGSGSILTRGEAIRNLFRGRRLGTMIVESMTPLNTQSGATLEFKGGYMSASFILSYLNDLDL